MSKHKRKGTCQGCGNSPRVLRQIESGQWVCQTCLRDIRGPKPPKAEPEEPRLRHFFTKVVGVTHKNRDGSDRQRIIGQCQLYETLVLVHEDENPVDPDAIAVKRQTGQQIGYLSADLAPEIAEGNRKGYHYAAIITSLTGGEVDRPTRGVNVVMVVARPGVSDREAQDYVNSYVAPAVGCDGWEERSVQVVDQRRGGRRAKNKSGCLVVLLWVGAALTWLALR